MPSGRGLTVRVKTANKRSVSSTRWLERQLNDPYVAERRSRAIAPPAFKLLQLDEKFIAEARRQGGRSGCGARRLDPGGGRSCGREGARGRHRPAADRCDPGADLIQMDFMDDAAPDLLKRLLDGPADLVLSDMAASATGHSQTDHLRIIALADAAYDFAKDVLKPHGAFVAKVLQGGATRRIVDPAEARISAEVKHVKPPASRSDSAEIYVVALGFRGQGRPRRLGFSAGLTASKTPLNQGFPGLCPLHLRRISDPRGSSADHLVAGEVLCP